MGSKELREKRANLVHQAQALLDAADEEKRDLTSEESQQFDALHKEADELKGKIDQREKHERAQAELNTPIPTVAGGKPQDRNAPEDPEERKAKESEAFYRWAVYGMRGLNPEQRSIMEQRAQSVGVDTEGGYTVPDGFVPRIETALKAFAGLRNTRATILSTQSGETINMPTSDDTSNSGELLHENTQVASQDVTFGSKALRAYMFSSKLVRVSIQFLQDVGVNNIEGWLADRLGERIGRATASYNLTGTGSNQPEGIATAATEGKQGASQTAITYDDLVDLEHSVDPAYRRQAEFLIGDGALKAVKKLKDGEGRPLWVPGMAVREPDTILGYRYAIDQGIPAPGASEITVYFGDFSKFYLRDVRQMQMLRLTERYADYLQVAFLLFMRHDSALLDAGTRPVKYFKQSA